MQSASATSAIPGPHQQPSVADERGSRTTTLPPGTSGVLRSLQTEIHNELSVVLCALAIMEQNGVFTEDATLHARRANQSMQRLGALVDAAVALAASI